METMLRFALYPLLAIMALAPFAQAKEINTNSIHFENAPSWVTSRILDRVVDRIQNSLEWDIRKIPVYGYTDQAAFRKVHGYDDTILAFARKKDSSVHVGPRVTRENFEAVFGHELVHIIVYQKYKDAIPAWLDEGMANFIAKNQKVDYAWLVSQPYRDVRTLAHPYQAFSVGGAPTPLYSYMATTAVMEMIASKCTVSDLLQLSLGKNLENYLSTFCDIPDLNEELRAWIKRKSRR